MLLLPHYIPEMFLIGPFLQSLLAHWKELKPPKLALKRWPLVGLRSVLGHVYRRTDGINGPQLVLKVE